MIILALQSALTTTEIALLNDGVILGEKQWEAQRDEAMKILPAMEVQLKDAGISLQDVKKILVVSGPGGFSSTRIGVTLANSLGYALKAEIFGMSIHQYETLAGASFGEKVQTFFAQNPEKVEQVLPLYTSAVKITASKKPKFT